VKRKLRVVPSAAPLEPDLSIDPAETARLLSGFIRAEVERTGKRKVVVGLSGGIDSALAAALAVEALGRAGVIAVMLPYRASAPSSLRDAEAVVGRLGIVAEKIDISAMVDGFVLASGDPGPRRLGNVMARARMIVLYDRSAEHDALVLGTSNKTELLLGYGTLHGDMASAINPIGDLYKTQVVALATWLGLPRAVLTKPPSADLWPGQTDEKDLGVTYDEADRIVALLVDDRPEGLPPEDRAPHRARDRGLAIQAVPARDREGVDALRGLGLPLPARLAQLTRFSVPSLLSRQDIGSRGTLGGSPLSNRGSASLRPPRGLKRKNRPLVGRAAANRCLVENGDGDQGFAAILWQSRQVRTIHWNDSIAVSRSPRPALSRA